MKLPDYTVRYWENEFKQLSPSKLSGRKRQYSKKEIKLLEKIKYMLHTQGYTIKGAKKVLNSQDKRDEVKIDFERATLKKNILRTIKEIEEILAK